MIAVAGGERLHISREKTERRNGNTLDGIIMIEMNEK